MTAPLTLAGLLARTVERGGSDLHLTAGAPPQVRLNGTLEAQADLGPLAPADAERLIYGGLTAAQRQRFEETLELDVSFEIEGVARVRANVFSQRGTVAAAYRLIAGEIRGFDMLGLPSVVARLAARPNGLVLVTGPTGSGKSTTLAALIDRINGERRCHILTIEDPVEYIHPHRRSIVNQREVHRDTAGFAPALRAALREDPRRGAHRRDARPGDDRGGAADRRDGPFDPGDAAYELGRARHRPGGGSVPGSSSAAGPHAALAGA